jgi:hypothetical protein
MEPLEALADAIMQFEGWKRDSRSWRNRNPGNLRPYNSTANMPVDDANYRIFKSLVDGYAALRVDLQSKFNGSHGLTRESKLIDLLKVYAPVGDANNPTAYTKFVCEWVSHILERQVFPSTTLGDYIGD